MARRKLKSGFKRKIGDKTFKKIMMSAVCAAALTSFQATASAQGAGVRVPLEIEGPLSAYTATDLVSGRLTVMGNTINVDANTEFVSPTDSRNKALRANGRPFETVTSWIAGLRMDGRRRGGLLGGTVIVTGEYDTATGTIYASEVFSDVSENVILGVITDSKCTTAACNTPGEYIRGNGDINGVGGTVFLPNKDARLAALPVTDAGLFAVDLSKAPLVGDALAPATFGGEGYFSERLVFPQENPATIEPEVATEQPLIYWAFELGEFRPDLVINAAQPEISSLRIRCTEGSRIEVRGFVHAAMDEFGNPTSTAGSGLPTSGGDGVIRVRMDDQVFIGEDPPVADLPAAYGVYRLRENITVCGTSATVEWAPDAAAPYWVQLLDVPVDRLREE